MASGGSKGLRGLGLLATGLGLGLMAVRARRDARDQAHVGTRTELSGLDAPVEETVTDVAPESVAEPVAPEPVVEDAPEPVAAAVAEPLVAVAPEAGTDTATETFFETPAEPAPELRPERPSWEIRAKARFERSMATTRHYRRALIAVCAVALALILLVAVPAIVRTRHTDRWQRCAERTTGTSLPPGGRVTRVVLDSCGPKPAFNRVPADRRN
jgi:hypothetical protein